MRRLVKQVMLITQLEQDENRDMSKFEYLRLNSKYLEEAEKLLVKKDYPQASEKLWGAFVGAAKALTMKQGISLGTQRS